MWVVGIVAMLAVAAVVTVVIGWTPRTTPSPPLWNVAQRGGATAGHASVFAGFSLASAIFVAGLDGARTNPAFPTVFGMMLIGFLILLVANWVDGSIPEGADDHDAVVLSLVLLLGNMCTNLGVGITWIALPPLLAMVGLSSLIEPFMIWLLVMALASAGWTALLVYRLTMALVRACLLIPVLSLALAFLYRLAVVRRWPALWPPDHAALHVAFVALGAVALIFVVHLGLLLAYGHVEAEQRLRHDGHRFALGACQAWAIVVGLLWVATALP